MSAPGELFEEGLSHHRAGRLDEAERLYRLALAGDADHADSLHLLGMIAFEAERLDEAAEMIRRAIVLHPGAASYYANLGNVLHKQGLVREAAESYLQALRIRPDLAEVHVNLGNVFLEAEQLEQAVTWYHSGLALNPGMAVAERQMGDALRRLRRFEEALAAYERALRLEPGSTDVWHWAGKVQRELGDLDGALRCFRAAQAIEPKHPRAGYGEAMVLLLTGQYGVGWAKYEGRWESLDHGTPMREFAWPVWCGERLESGKVLLWPEQGVGDEIMFAGMLRDAVETGNRIVLACDGRLRGLMARSFPEIEVVADGAGMLEGIGAQLPIGSLPELFRRTAAAFEGVRDGYLVADPERRRALRDRYEDGRRVVGVAWRSNNVHTGAGRSIELGMLAGLMGQAGSRWVCLQYGEAEELAAEAAAAGVELVVDDGVEQMVDLDGFAAQVAAMDLVVTIDNTTAHLAGALGVPVWLLLPFGPDWRWGSEGNGSVWYPGMRVFRQTRRGDWGPVVMEVAEGLRALLG